VREKDGYGGWVKWDEFEEEDEERDKICMERGKIKWKGMILGENGWKIEKKWGKNGGCSYGVFKEKMEVEKVCREEYEV